jgi:phosphate transport system substrate-binding protein
VIALDGIAVIVNPANGVSSLTKSQIADVFGGKLLNWSQLGGPNLPIALYARDNKSGTFDTFKHLVLGPSALAPDARRFESSEELSDAVAGDARAIGFIGLPYVRSAKAVMVQEAGSVPLLPSPTTVATEDYPLARRLYLYVPFNAPVVAREFVDFALSEEGQNVVAQVGFVDLLPECDPDASRCTVCSPEYRNAVRGACRVSVDFRFDRGSTQLDTRALRDLQRLVTLMGHPANAARTVLLFGFSDGTGARPDNLYLSRQRAGIVASQLRARGLPVAVARGFGPDTPIADDATDDGRERNRRVEVWLR